MTYEQLADLRARHPTSVLLLRDDKVCAAYGPDAERVAGLPGACARLRPCRFAARATFPADRLDLVLSQLLRQGQSVAICENVEER